MFYAALSHMGKDGLEVEKINKCDQEISFLLGRHQNATCQVREVAIFPKLGKLFHYFQEPCDGSTNLLHSD